MRIMFDPRIVHRNDPREPTVPAHQFVLRVIRIPINQPPKPRSAATSSEVRTESSETMAMAFKMATEGMRVKQECLSSFMEMKWKKVSRYVVYKIDEKSREVMVDKVGRPGEGYEGLAASLPNDDCRYAVFDFDFLSVDNCQKSKIFFITWSPTASRIRSKILYATSKQGLRRLLEGIHYEVQATDPTEMGFDVIKERAK
ncbi:actin-depolymerizing factor 5 [Musa troglodytarum]|uniref:Actin-depolymerizing factor 5 n=3 Tax=Musa TaxID=4640 RepID=A0A9E7K5E4_9LILI|nr:actin-depolymerizing factor 5 [Musa troglodytarum]